MNAEAIAAEHADRLTTADPLLPLSEPFEATGADTGGPTFQVVKGDSGASGVTTTSEVHAEFSDSLWRALKEHRLTVRLAGSQSGEVFAQLLTQWDEHLSGVCVAGDWETAAVVVRPSRDTGGSAALLRHGFAPVRVLAARPADRLAAPGPAAEPGVRIRPATPDDPGNAVAMDTALVRYDQEFGGVSPRRNT